MDNNKILDIYPLHVEIKHKIARYNRQDGVIVCDNSNYQIIFTFDDEWSEYSIKTARFVWNNSYTDVVFNGTTCEVPILKDTSFVAIGVYAGDLRTTTPAIIYCKKSILCENPERIPPEPDVYNQIMKLMNGFSIKVEKVGNETTITTTDPNGTHAAIVYDGEKGEPGKNGITPHIGENGHWFVGSEDTGVPAQGNGSGRAEWGNIGGTLSNQTDLKNALDSKANKTELEGLSPVSANSGTGTVDLQTLTVGDTTYSIPQSGGVTDVQINGKSIITDGVAHIPITKSNWSEASGFVLRRIHKSYGLAVLDGGTAAIMQATKNQIDGRSSNYNPLAPEKLDYAVKAAMCDGKGAAWTDAERIAALLRMGCTVDENGFVKWTAQEVAE